MAKKQTGKVEVTAFTVLRFDIPQALDFDTNKHGLLEDWNTKLQNGKLKFRGAHIFSTRQKAGDAIKWSVVRWKSPGGYAVQNSKKNENNARECLYVSSHCPNPSPDLFAASEPG